MAPAQTLPYLGLHINTSRDRMECRDHPTATLATAAGETIAA